MFRHHDIADYDKTVAPTRLFENHEEAITSPRGTEKRQSPIARTGDKVQMVRARHRCDASRSASTPPWYRQHGVRPCKKRKSLP